MPLRHARRLLPNVADAMTSTLAPATRHGPFGHARDRPGKEDGEMPQKAWTDKRERQYEHIKDSYEERGVGEDEAEERAARTVNKERREAGETKDQKERGR
jgi:hypothetical protein